MGVVLVGRLVQIDDLGRTSAENRQQIGKYAAHTRRLHVAARMTQLDHQIVTPEFRRAPLLRPSDRLHLFVTELGVRSGARRTCSIGHDHTGEEFIIAPVTRRNAVMGHDLNVILMRDHTEMSGSGQRCFRRQARLYRIKNFRLGS